MILRNLSAVSSAYKYTYWWTIYKLKISRWEKSLKEKREETQMRAGKEAEAGAEIEMEEIPPFDNNQ